LQQSKPNGMIKNDEEHGLIKISISSDLRFKIQGVYKPYKAMENMEIIFGKHIEI
jgi:hypothetical protein